MEFRRCSFCRAGTAQLAQRSAGILKIGEKFSLKFRPHLFFLSTAFWSPPFHDIQSPAARSAAALAARSFSAGPTLKEVLDAQVPVKQQEMKDLKAKYGSMSLGNVTVDQCIGGGRGIKSMLYETSLLDADEVSPRHATGGTMLSAALPLLRSVPASPSAPLPRPAASAPPPCHRRLCAPARESDFAGTRSPSAKRSCRRSRAPAAPASPSPRASSGCS